MFALSDDDLARSLLGCGDGPASFNAEATKAGVEVISVDPIYALSAEEIRARVESVFDEMVNQTAANAADFLWGHGVDDLDDLVALFAEADVERINIVGFHDDDGTDVGGYELVERSGQVRTYQLGRSSPD